MTYIPNEQISITSAIGVNSDNVISGGNWVGDTYTGAGEENDYAYVGVNLQVDEGGTLFFDFSQDGTNWSTYPVGGFTVVSGINEVHTAWKGGRYMRPRFVGTGGRSYFRLKTFYSNTALPLSAPLNQSIGSDQDAQVVRAVGIGEDPLGAYVNEKTDGIAFKTTANLNAGATFDSGVLDLRSFNQVQTQIVADQDGTLEFIFGNSDTMTGNTTGANGVDRVLTIPYESVKGFESFSAPAFTDYVRYKFTNNGGVATTHLFYDTKFLTKALSGQVLSTNAPIADGMVANLGRNIQVGKDINGNFNNLPSSSTDTNNSSTTPLGIDSDFIGAWSFVEPYGEIKVAVVADVPSDNCFLQLSDDGVTVRTSLNLPPQLVAGKYRFIHSLNPSLPYFRVVYENGAVAQTEFMLNTSLLVQTGNGFISRSTQVLDRYTDVKIVRTVNDPVIDRNLGLINYQQAKRKWGVNEAVGNSVHEDVWAEGGDYPLLETATTVRIQAGGDVNDTAAGSGAREITIEGLDQNWNEVTETIATAGASASASTTTTFIRVNRVYVSDCGTFAGNNTGIIRIEDTAATVGVLAHIPAGLGNTFQAIVAVPAGKTIYITKVNTSVGESDSADVRLWRVNDGNLAAPCKRYESVTADFAGFQPDTLETYFKFDERETIGWDAIRITGQGTARVSVEFDYVLIDNV
jgi:hypothetical protein